MNSCLAALTLSLLFLASSAQAALSEKSIKIQAASLATAAISDDGKVKAVKVKPGTVKEMIREFALKNGNYDSAKDFDADWQEKPSNDIWGADTMIWGPVNMKDAWSYVFTNSALEEKLAELSGEKKTALARKIAAAKEAFKGFLGTGVEFAAGMNGAVQCGVTFASLMILDRDAGLVYQIIMEGSGC